MEVELFSITAKVSFNILSRESFCEFVFSRLFFRDSCGDGNGCCGDGDGSCSDGVGSCGDGVGSCGDGSGCCGDGVGCCDGPGF